MTSASENKSADRQQLVNQLAAIKKQGDLAKKAAKVAKAAVKQEKHNYKEAKRTAKKLRKAGKALEAELASLATKTALGKSPRRKSKPKGQKTTGTSFESIPAHPVSPPSKSTEPLS